MRVLEEHLYTPPVSVGDGDPAKGGVPGHAQAHGPVGRGSWTTELLPDRWMAEEAEAVLQAVSARPHPEILITPSLDG